MSQLAKIVFTLLFVVEYVLSGKSSFTIYHGIKYNSLACWVYITCVYIEFVYIESDDIVTQKKNKKRKCKQRGRAPFSIIMPTPVIKTMHI